MRVEASCRAFAIAGVDTGRVHHGMEETPSYLGSPWEHVFSTGTVYRRRLDDLDEDLDHALLHEVKALGGTDYCALPLRSVGRVIGAIGMALALTGVALGLAGYAVLFRGDAG